MLSAAQLRATPHRRRSPYSDKQYYQEYILQRIEGYKNSIGRDELLRLGDEAAAELHTAAEGQFLLTEVLMLESVDRLIMKRLSLRPYNRWRRQFLKLREAQRTPTHWGLDPTCPLARLLPRIEPRDVGTAHLCFLVDDLVDVHQRLVDAGVDTFVSPPVLVDTGINTGGWGIYLRDPDGIVLEIFQPPRRDPENTDA